MGYMDGHMGNATPATYWWKSPRWIVIRIEALAVVAIIISFLLAIFGPCRRWSNRWIVQKGFFAAQVLSLSLGTYSIGLMQSSSVKSEMYPIWTVSLFTLFGCIDPVTTYNGLDYKGPLSKVVYGICLSCGYVLFMSISTISNVVGNTAIITLSAITFIKSFHRSFALVEQNKLCDMVTYSDSYGEAHIFTEDGRRHRITDDDISTGICGADIEASTRNKMLKWLPSCCDVWVALCLSHKLRRYFLGLDYHVPRPTSLQFVDLKWALKLIEIELAFVYDALFTGNPFLHYYQAKTASLWALASFAGICFVLVAFAIPGGITRHSCATGCSKVVGTTTADLVITFGILVSLALLQLMQLVRSWTSNWALVAVFCAYTGKDGENFPQPDSQSLPWGPLKLSGWMRLKTLVATSTNLFDKYLWQDKIGQYSMLPKQRILTRGQKKGDGISSSSETKAKSKLGRLLTAWWERKDEQGHTKGERIRRTSVDLVHMLGLHYIWQVIWELFIGDSNKRGGIKLDEDAKGSVTDFLGQLQSDQLDMKWLSSLPKEPWIRYFLPQFSAPQLLRPEDHCYRYISCLLTWHIATWYCEHESKEEDALMSKQAEAPICLDEQAGGGEEGTKTRDHRHVANALSKYCIYLVKSAPELLPGPVGWAKRVYNRYADDAKVISDRENMSDRIVCNKWEAQNMDKGDMGEYRISNSKALAKLLRSGRSSDDEVWKTLALVWVQLLVYAAPYGNAEAHMRHLAQGGEFITHLWALLYHLDIHEWNPMKRNHKVPEVPEVPEVNNLHDISTVEDAQTVLNNDDLDIVVVFVEFPEVYRDDFATASNQVDGVKFYLTSSREVAKCLYFPETMLRWSPGVLFLNKADKKPIVYDDKVHGWYYPWNVAQFVYENKLASAKARAQETAPSTSHNPIPIDMQRWEDGQTGAEITEEIPPPS